MASIMFAFNLGGGVIVGVVLWAALVVLAELLISQERTQKLFVYIALPLLLALLGWMQWQY